MSSAYSSGHRRTPYIRWERSLVGGTELVQALQQNLLDFGVNPIDLKPPETASVSIAPAPHFKNAIYEQGMLLDYAALARCFLRDTDRTPLKTVPAPSNGVGIIKGRDGVGSRVALQFSSPVITSECTAINGLLHRGPYRSYIHISVGNIPTQAEEDQIELTRRLSALVSGDIFQFEPVMQKSVARDGSTSLRTLRSLEREYYIQRVKQFFVSGFGSDFPRQHADDASPYFCRSC